MHDQVNERSTPCQIALGTIDIVFGSWMSSIGPVRHSHLATCPEAKGIELGNHVMKEDMHMCRRYGCR